MGSSSTQLFGILGIRLFPASAALLRIGAPSPLTWLAAMEKLAETESGWCLRL
jgi:hypothetical protein